jgi:sulfite dehydrogenase (cytochrome) subunit B
MKPYALAALLSLAALPAAAQDEKIVLKDGPGRDAVEVHCSVCHSLDYIPMNSKFLDRAKWDATIKKMSGPYGAGIAPEDAKVILDYLAANYGS